MKIDFFSAKLLLYLQQGSSSFLFTQNKIQTMKKIYIIAWVVALLSSCNGSSLCDNDLAAELANSNPSYKISIDSLKKQAVGLSDLFGGSSTKSGGLSVGEVIPMNHLLLARGVSKSVSADPSDPQAYVVNFADDAGFAILADDARLGNNVLAYSESGTLDASVGNPGVLFFMEQTGEYLNAAAKLWNEIPPPHRPEKYEPNRSQRPSNWGEYSRATYAWVYDGLIETSRTSNLLSVKWGQRAPFNQLSPVVDGVVCLAGCVATAAVQIMSYFNHPTAIAYFADNVSYPINWSQAKQGAIVGGNIHYLMRDFGYRVWMSYSPKGSGASDDYVPYAMRYYGYSCSGLVDYDISVVVSEIDNNRPVYVRGAGSDGGHAWVADGYLKALQSVIRVIDYIDDSDPNHPTQIGQEIVQVSTPQPAVCFLHMNWGWDGRNNGYFRSFDFLPSNVYEYDGVATGSTYDFNQYQSMIYSFAKQ